MDVDALLQQPGEPEWEEQEGDASAKTVTCPTRQSRRQVHTFDRRRRSMVLSGYMMQRRKSFPGRVSDSERNEGRGSGASRIPSGPRESGCEGTHSKTASYCRGVIDRSFSCGSEGDDDCDNDDEKAMAALGGDTVELRT